MFALNPGGSDSDSSGSSPLRQQILDFGKLGLYFGALHLAYVFMSGSGEAAPKSQK
jgi:hypothetical protein